ncbi:hypothetical protein HPB49_025487 [Dermacentor silvarum]|uniref:Uncharacterized protein n=1 Tax=Dermacentor silvarum TaxID=543639 RepID=A0ACB8D9K8_DERSI|nr:hypothetical protein HPB49_025487 [Dermacentor silvarum]
MAHSRIYAIIVFLMLAGLIFGIVAAVFAYIVLDSSLSWPTEKWEYKGTAIISDAKECANVAKTIDKMYAVDALGVAPAGTQSSDLQKNWSFTTLGYKAPIIPGAVAGYKLLHERFGKLPWADLFTDAVALADKGFIVGPRLAAALKRNKKALTLDDNGRLVENIKFALAFRENLGDNDIAISEQDKLLSKIQMQYDKHVSSQHTLASYEDYGGLYIQDEDFGGAHLSILDAKGNAISVTAGLNHEFGSKFWTSSGILLNSYMGAFPDPKGKYGRNPSPNNILAPGKQPLTSMIPSVITNTTGNKRQIHAIFGSSGGIAGISAMAQLFACAAEFPLYSCVSSNVAMHPILGKDGYMVQVGAPNAKFDPASILLKMGHKVEKKNVFTSSATAIVTTGRDSWMAPADPQRTDGGSAGDHYEHPVIKNDRVLLGKY